MQKNDIRNGIYPTMITPYTRGNELDEDALRRLVQWYWEKGCHGIFAACQSSEIFFLSLQERCRSVEIVKKESLRLAARDHKAPMTIVASGHISDELSKQAEELTMIHEAGADAIVIITNRLDISRTDEIKWLRELSQLLQRLPDNIPLGIYECPTPYKRLLSPQMLKEVRDSGRFVFFKDTCCDPNLLRERAEYLSGSGLKLFNANAQTLLLSLRTGGSGYCGIMANFHPELYVWLYDNYQIKGEALEYLADVLSMTAFSEVLAYPITAKYFLDHFENIPMELLSRSCELEKFGEYDKLVMKQLKQLNMILDKKYNLN